MNIVFMGLRGVGKTTLLNKLLGEQRFDVNEVREKDSKGRHTTARRQLIRLESGSIFIDTPGMRELGTFAIDTGLDETFDEIASFSSQCRFKDCTHIHEEGCAVKEAVEPARGRGGVVEIPDTSGLPCDLMIFLPTVIVFVKVKRMRAKVRGPRDVAIKYGPEIRALRIVPESGAALMELWILSSHSMWQYFRILPDSIVELRENGEPFKGTG